MSEFRNEPELELRRGPEREALRAALAELDRELPLAVPVLVGGDAGAGEGIDSTDPGDPGRLVARAGRGGAGEAAAAVEAAQRGAREWGARSAAERAAVLERAASILRERRRELAALCLRECAKPWAEADADVCEAIDYLRYYGRRALELERGPELHDAPGERNRMRYFPRGVAAVISPWNFPLAIPAGMTAAALAAGNAVVLKPAEQSPGCALRLVEALHEAGVPVEALSLLPGQGEAGAALVRDPRVHLIAFTGSSAVGLEIVAAASQTPPGQDHVKRVIAEMGGKNCAIVDSDADLDEVVPDLVASAFAYAGQKCSAASRLLAHEAIAEALLARLGGAIETLEVGPAEDFGTDVPPLIEQAAQRRVEGYAEAAAQSGRLVAEAGGEAPARGWYSRPRLVADPDPAAPVLREEVFGPLLTLERVADARQAFETVESLPYALTGGLFSRSPDVVAEAAARLPVGNLYVNRAITGARVGQQPFGGNRRSGVGSKAGGPDYLLQFAEPRVLTENVMRHGIPMD